MANKSNEYGFVPSSPTQAYGSNTGIFESNDITDLINASQWSRPGQLELIETQTITSTTLVEFDLTGNYNVYFLTFNDVKMIDTKEMIARLSNDNGATFEVGSNYDSATQRGDSAGTFYEYRSPNNGHFIGITSLGSSTNETQNGYMYLYNALDSSKMTFSTWHSMGFDSGGNGEFHFGSGVYKPVETTNAIQFKDSGGTGIQNGVFSLYGIRYS